MSRDIRNIWAGVWICGRQGSRSSVWGMSKARLVITAVVVEGRSQCEVARSYGVCQGWISRLVARYTGPRVGRPSKPGPEGPSPHRTQPARRWCSGSLSCGPGLPMPGWTPARTPSAGICGTRIGSPSPGQRSTGSWSAPGIPRRVPGRHALSIHGGVGRPVGARLAIMSERGRREVGDLRFIDGPRVVCRWLVVGQRIKHERCRVVGGGRDRTSARHRRRTA